MALSIEQSDEKALIKISIISATHLRDADKALGGGSSDPFCVVRHNGKKTPIIKTQVIANTLSPEWNHPALQLDGVDVSDTFEIEVLDHDMGGATDLLGKCTMGAAKFLPNGFEGSLELDQTKNFPSKIQLKVEVLRIPLSLRKEARRAATDYAAQEALHAGARVKVSIISATGLRNADKALMGLGGKSDPYCKCKLMPNKDEVAITHVEKDTLAPIWNLPPFEVEHVPISGKALYFEVRDQDPGKTDDLLGDVYLDADKFLPNGFTGTVLLENAGKGYTPTLVLGIEVLEMPPEVTVGSPRGLRGLCLMCCGPPDPAASGATEEAGHVSAADMSWLDQVKQQAFNIADAIDNTAENVAVMAEDQIQQLKATTTKRLDFVTEFTSRFKTIIDQWVKQQVLIQVEIILDSLPAVIKTNLGADPYVVKKAWKFQCSVVDSLWPEVRKELVKAISQAMGKSVLEDKIIQQEGGNKNAILAYFRYTLDPFDRSIWGKMMSPVWWILTIGFYLPLSAASAFVIAFIFLIIDKRDHYQLCSFIVSTKAVQFVAHFLLRVVIGYIMYCSCVMGSEYDDMGKCQDEGPAILGPPLLIFIGWGIQIVLPWLAYLFLPCSQRRERLLEEAAEDDAEEGDDRIGGKYQKFAANLLANAADKDKKHMRRIMYYDFFATALVIAAMAVALATFEDGVDDFRSRQVLLACQVTYGFLCIPYFLFALPGLQKILLHCDRTAYDQHGRTRRYKGAVAPAQHFIDFEALDTDEVMDQFMGMFGAKGSEVKEDEIFHVVTEKPVTKTSKCEKCRTSLKVSVGSSIIKAQCCKDCSAFFCPKCSGLAQKIVCKEREAKWKKQQGQEKENAQKEKEEADQKTVETLKQSGLGRYSALGDYWNMTKKLVDTLRTLGSSEGQQHIHEFTELMRSWVKKQSNTIVEVVVKQVPVILKDALEEEDMPPRAKRIKNAVVDNFWNEMSEEIMYSMQVLLDGQVIPEEKLDQQNPGVDCIRAKLRQAFMPHDKSIWWQIRQPAFWILTLLPLIPISICVPLTFLVIWIVIDKTDEFQLINFILRFKGTQFISLGLIKNAIGFYSYLGCTTETPPMHSCATSGPGTLSDIEYEMQLYGLVAQILLAWSCFILLPFSKDKGRIELEGTGSLVEAAQNERNSQNKGDNANADTNTDNKDGEEKKEEKKEDKKDEKKEGEKPEEKRKLSESPSSEISGVQEALAKQKGGFDIHQGGRLRWLLFWDIAAALVAAGILVWLYADNDWKAKWRVQQGFFAIQVLYGYMAVPFFFFNFPVFKTVLTHSAITGYDDKGRVRPLESPAAKSAEDLAKEFEEIEASQKKKEGRDNTKKVDTKESNEKGLITQIKALIDDAWDGEFDNEEPEKKPKK